MDEPGQRFAEGYKKHLWESYNKYSHEDTEILIEITPKFVEIWDTSDDGYAFQLFLDFEKKSVEVKQYDARCGSAALTQGFLISRYCPLSASISYAASSG